MAGLGHHVVVTDDGARLHAEVSGDAESATTVVLAHGWSLSGASWANQVRDLGRHARVVSYDQRGHGRSSRGEAGVSIDRLGEDMHTVIEQLAPEGPVVLAGHSMGGMTIMALAASHPDVLARRVAGVVLVNTSAGRLAEPTFGLPRLPGRVVSTLLPKLMAAAVRWSAALEHLRRRLAPPSRRLVQRGVRWLLFGPEVAAETVLTCAQIIHATSMHTIGEFYPALAAHEKHAALAALRDVPTVILAGARDRLTPPRHSRTLAEALPEARLVVVPDEGHMLPMAQPELVTAHLRELVAAA